MRAQGHPGGHSPPGGRPSASWPDQLCRAFATGMLVGYFPIAPGTAGSVLAAAIYWFVWPSHLFIYGILVLFLFLLGTWASTIVEQQLGPDPCPVVIDEMVGLWIALFALPRQWALLIIGFVLFRIFDIWKPFPIRAAERLPRGWGIMADDALSGVCTNLLLRLALILRG